MLMRVTCASLILCALAACASPARLSRAMVSPSAETAPAPSNGDAADDPAIWVNPVDGAASRILGTDKKSGLYVFDMAGALVQSLPVGALNNVDLRQGIAGVADIAAATNRTNNSVALFRIRRADGQVEPAGEFAVGQAEPYGLCMARIADAVMVIVTYKDGLVEMFTVDGLDSGKVEARLAGSARLGSQLEGCVADEAHDRLFVGEEARGVWAFALSDLSVAPQLIAAVGAAGLAADVEGVSLWRGAKGTGHLVVSAQGANRYVVYERTPPFAPRGIFSIRSARGDRAAPIDGVSQTDGLDIAPSALGAAFPRGVLIVQDGANTDPVANQNFKIIDWRAIEIALGLSTPPPETQ